MAPTARLAAVCSPDIVDKNAGTNGCCDSFSCLSVHKTHSLHPCKMCETDMLIEIQCKWLLAIVGVRF